MTQVMEARGLKFVVDDPIEAWRVQTLETKEPGTIQWLEDTLKPGDVFYDIGANIGVYTLVASRILDDFGHVYAFEPHVVNAASLIRNVASRENVTVLTCALHDGDGLVDFNYTSLRAGSSGSQLGHCVGQDSREFTPAAVETKVTASLSQLIDKYDLPSPTVMKIDTDGHEHSILSGMLCQGLRPHLPRSIQVELGNNNVVGIHRLLTDFGYVVDRVHYTAQGQKQINAGANPDDVINNTVFVRR